MSVFVDTNVLLRSIQPTDASHELAVRAIAAFIRTEESLVITPQVAAEFWYAATRSPAKNGLGLPPDQARQELAQLEAFVTIIAESPEVYDEWKSLLVVHGITGVDAHDARLVAAMKVHGITRMLTFDVKDFARYTNAGFEAIHPEQVLR